MLRKLLNLTLFRKWYNGKKKQKPPLNDAAIVEQETPDLGLSNDKIYKSQPYKQVADNANAINIELLEALKKAIISLPESKQNISFIKLGLTTRSLNTFSRENIETPYDFFQIPDKEILAWYLMGTKSLEDITEAIRNLGKPEQQILSLGDQDTLPFDKSQTLEEPWLNQFFMIREGAQNAFTECLISNDESYIENKNKLPNDLLNAADNFRFSTLIKHIDRSDPLSVLKISPGWLLDMDIFYFECGTRNKNVIEKLGVERLIDICKFTLSDLMRMPNMGRKSIEELSEDITKAQKKGPPPKGDTLNEFKGSLKGSFFSSLEKIKDGKHRFIIEERLGVNGRSKTLDEIGTILGITRERVRQIQKKVIEKIIDGEFWDDVLRMKLEDIIEAQTAPLYLSNMSAYDPWFDGFCDNVYLLQKIFEHFAHIKPQFLHLKDKIIITHINNDAWKNIKSTLLDSFEYSLDLHYTLEDIEMLIEHELVIKKAKELSTLMFDEIFPQLNFSLVEGEMVLVSIGNSIGSYLKALLEQEEKPLHYSEIRNLYEQKYGVKLSARNIHARLSYGSFLLFGRGTYGVERHLKFVEEQQSEIIKFCENFLEKHSHRQCHSQEIVKAINGGHFSKSAPKIDKFILNILLAKSDRLSYLGKMVWIYGSDEGTDTERLHIRKTVADILRKKGKAMRIEEIEKEIIKVRSVGVNFSVNLQPNDLFSRVDPATWGLLDRDFILSPKEWRSIKDSLYQHFEKTNKSLHTSELHDLVKNFHLDTPITLGHIIGILSSDGRFKKWRGGFIGLSSWAEPNRVTLSEALDTLIDKNAAFISTDMLEGKIESILGYSFEKNRISMYLNKNGFMYSRKENLWKKAS